MGEKTNLFVYGTLRPPSVDCSPVYTFNFPKVAPFVHRIMDAWLDGADLFDLGSFPAAIPGSGRVVGTILEIDEAAFEVLDPLEGHPELYHRELVRANTQDGPLEAWIYWAPEDLALEGVRIESGDWLLGKPGRSQEPGL